MLCPTRPTLLLFVLMSTALNTSAQPFQRIPLSDGQDSRQEQWKLLYPPVSLRDWSVQMWSSPDVGRAEPRMGQLQADEWIPIRQSEMEENAINGRPGDWQGRAGDIEKRNIVVADDAAFREKSKLLTAMERQKWLNSYMQKLLVVNSK